MILEIFLVEKPSVACTTIVGLIFSTRCSITQGAGFVTFVCIIIDFHTRFICISWPWHSLMLVITL